VAGGIVQIVWNSSQRARYVRAGVLTVGILVLVSLFFILRDEYALPALFLYTISANSFIPFPHEPAVLYYGALYPPLTVAAVCGVATCFSALIDYSVLGTAFTHRRAIHVKETSRLYKLGERYFNQTPFWTMVFAGFTPVPFYPFRVMGIASGYARWKYVLSTFAGRTPRYYILARLGNDFTIPGEYLILLFVLMILPPIIRLLHERLARNDA
jgi:membrane protein YqaA with SNARE-associated domain